MTTTRTSTIPPGSRTALVAALLWCCVFPGVASAQMAPGGSPVFLQDSQRAADALPRAIELASSELYDEAARVLYELALSDGVLLLEQDDTPDVLRPVRVRINDTLLARPELLARFREIYAPMARASLDAGDAGTVERSLLLTTPGFDAAMSLAQEHLENARFHTAWRTLAQLDRHPDRVSARAERAAALLTAVWTYIDGQGELDALDRGAQALLRSWRREARMPDIALDPADTPVFPLVRTPFDDPGAIRIDGVLSQPLISRSTGPSPQIVSMSSAMDTSIPRDGRVLHAAPILVGDTIYTNTTERIAAWNRFTGQQKWSTPIEAPVRQLNRFSRNEALMEEVATLVAADGVLVALTGAPVPGTFPERLLVGIEPETGSVRWRIALSQSLDDRLRGAVFDGPPVLVEGVVVVGAIENDLARRTVTRHLAGFDAVDGSLLWAKPVTSVGATSYRRQRVPAEGLAALGADVFRVSPQGAIMRIEGVTGRVRWVRREALDQTGARTASSAAPWRFHTPVVHDRTVYTMTPDRRRLLALDAESGAIIARADARDWKDPYELHMVGDTLMGVSDTDVVMCAPSEINRVEEVGHIVHLTGRDSTSIRGRAVQAGDRLFLPMVGALAWVQRPVGDAPPESGRIPLDYSGNALVLDGQLVVADDARLHTYFAWDVARELLSQRERRDTTDAGAPLTYAQLAYRAGETEEIAPALDRAVSALAADPLREEFSQQRRAMFEVVLAMARPDRDPSRLARLTPRLRRGLLDRLEQLAVTPDERVSSLMTAGAYFEAIDDAPRAVERYQRLLADATLHRRPFEIGGIRTPAAEEVARRLTTLVAASGRSVYAPYDAIASDRVQRLGDNATPGQLAAIARTFPVARVTPRVYQQLGETLEAAGEIRSAVDAYESGLRAVLPGEQPDLAGELAGRAIVQAARSGRLASARLRLREFATLSPTSTLTYLGRALDAQRLDDQIGALERFAQRRPRIAGRLVREPDLLPGYRVQHPIIRNDTRAPTNIVVFRNARDDTMAIWGVNDEGVLIERWAGLQGHDLLHVTSDRVYTTTLENTKAGRRIVHCFESSTGQERWRSLAFEDIFDPRVSPSLAPDDEGLSAFDLDDSAREIVVSVGDRTLVLTERSGRVAGIDLETGAVLWAERLPVSRVLDVDAGSGVVGIVGLRRRTIEELRLARIEPPRIEERLTVLDERTGETLHAPSLARMAQWVRVAPEGSVLVGCEGAVLQFALRSGRLMGEINMPELMDSNGVAVFAGRSYILSSLGLVLGLTTDSGRLEHQRVDTGNRIGARPALMHAEEIGDLVYLASPTGFVALDRDHRLVTADTRAKGATSLVPAFTERYALVVGTSGEESSTTGFKVFPVTVHDLSTGRLMDAPVLLPLPSLPDTLRVIDGHVLISAGASTVILHAPPEDGYVRADDPTFELERVYAEQPIEQTAPSPEATIQPMPVTDTPSP